ncbi:MAG: MFS transporter [Patescibacteria group bacterium]|nr:MFS transporter [Patescibacteria group bacterium]
MFGLFENHHNLYFWLPKIEKTTFDVSLVHFLLMFGYKLFSLYYPLFLISIGFSIINVGSIYLLTYSVIAVSSVIINYYIHRFNPSKVAAIGIFGYGIFALLMIVSHNLIVFYIAQIILGFSAAAWLVSLKLILMKSKTDSKSRSFGWFYSMPHYAAAIAPVIGGLVIWKFGFTGVFALSVLIQFANAFYAYKRLNGKTHNWFYNSSRVVRSITQKKELWSQHKLRASIRKNYSNIFKIIRLDKAFILILMSLFSALVLGGIYRAFFVLFLENLYFSQEEVIKLIAIGSIVYFPLSIIVIKIMGKLKNVKIISSGMAIEGAVTIILGVFANVMNLLGLFTIMIIDTLGALLLGSGKSALLSKKLKNYQEEASTIDTVLTTICPAVGAFVGGIAISYIGFQSTFLIMGIIVFMMGIISWFYKLKA